MKAIYPSVVYKKDVYFYSGFSCLDLALRQTQLHPSEELTYTCLISPRLQL